MGSLYFLFFLGVISYLKPFWNVVACVLFSPFVHVCRRFFPSFTLTPIPLAAVVSTFIDHRLQRRCGEINKRAENHYRRRLVGHRRRDVVLDRNKGVSVTLTNSQIDRRRGANLKTSRLLRHHHLGGLLLFLSFICTKKCRPIDLLRFFSSHNNNNNNIYSMYSVQ